MTIKLNIFGFVAVLVGVGSAAWVMAGMGLPHEHNHDGNALYSQDRDHHDHEHHVGDGHDHGEADHGHEHQDADAHRHDEEDHDGHAGQGATVMPEAKEGDSPEEQKLFFTPGGLYTQADIQANGSQLPMDKFRDIASEHDMNPKKGDLLCPITMTKANKKFPWQIGGKTYYFCCPPCIGEFVKRAKEKPSDFPSPVDLIKK